MAHDARAVANFLLDCAEGQGKRLTIMALIKIIYFAHGWHLARSGAPLISNPFEAWQHGPVVRVVYDCFSDHGSHPITSRATRFDPISQAHEVVRSSFTVEEAALLGDVFKAYGWLDAFRLSEITHATGSPWDRVWNASDGKITLGMRIPNESIRQHFLAAQPSQVGPAVRGSIPYRVQ